MPPNVCAAPSGLGRSLKPVTGHVAPEGKVDNPEKSLSLELVDSWLMEKGFCQNLVSIRIISKC